MKDITYLDYNATSPMRKEVVESVMQIMNMPYNASAIHSLGRAGKKFIDNARQNIANLCGADKNNVIFNSGATEGNNTVLKYFADQGPIMISHMDHPSILEALPNPIIIPALANGTIDLEKLESLAEKHKPTLVSVMLANNETGIIQPTLEISKIARKYGAYFHSDCTQAAGRIKLDILNLGIDFMTLSAHKIAGPQGVGALVLGLCGDTPTLLEGGGQEKKARAGTENVAGIAGFGKAAELALKNLETYQSQLLFLQKKLENGIRSIVPGSKVYGQNMNRLCNTTMFTIPGKSSETMLMAFDLEGIAISNGSACSSGSVKASHVLLAMGEKDAASNAIRVSTGWNTKEENINDFLFALEKIMAR